MKGHGKSGVISIKHLEIVITNQINPLSLN